MSFENKSESIRFPQIASELKEMVDIDQDMRERSHTEDYWDETIDAKHTERMKEIVGEIGWPTISKVGKEGANHAWLLVQHADHDVDFQEHCLQLMKDAPADEVDVVNIVYLTDRVCGNRGVGQLYGTQFIQENGKHIPRTIDDEENVDARRAEVGMGPLSEQIQHMYNKYPLDEEE
ncbi:MAG: DUF6624 domain-containing protein [Candidatus Paceibacterota bacterium]